jgi:hypothetical protein
MANTHPGWVGARMGYPDHLNSGLSHHMSDTLVETGPTKQQDPSTSSQPSLAHPGQWIRRHTRRQTLKRAILILLNFVTLCGSLSFEG